MEDWDEIWRRNQFVCAGLARRYPRQKILFVGLSRDYSHRLRTGDFRCSKQPIAWTVPELPNITVVRPFKLLPNTFAGSRRINEKCFRWYVGNLAAKLGLQHPLLWLNPHSAVHMVGKMGEVAVIYDITDDWLTLTQHPRQTALIQEQDHALCRTADAVIVCSEQLQRLKSPYTESLYLIPNGVDASHYQSPINTLLPPAQETHSWRHPVLGYTGTIHPDRVDLSLVESLAKTLTDSTIAMIGPLFIDDDARRRLEALGNVVFTGPKPYATIPAYMRAFDVCITPHHVSAFTDSLNPIKLWEYFAVGKPIISTRVAGFRDYPELVYLADDAADFVHELSHALREDASLPTRRRQKAKTHSWDTRLDAIENVMARCLT